ncbi:GIP [Symbiodinium sp. CCMP2592]|nr:GIP [Symbiodinium sp. CCMP2592]
MPFFGSDEDCVQITWDSDRVIYAHKVDDYVPVFREQIRFGGDGLHRALAAGESAPAAPAEVPAPAVPAEDPPLPAPAAPPPPDPGEGSGADDEGDEDAPTKAQRLITEAQSLQHRLTHMPKNPYCDVCSRSRMLKKRTARTRYAKCDDELDPVEEFGQRIAADFIIVHKDAKSTETVVLTVRDEATGYIRAFPLVSRHEDGVVRSLLSFLGRRASGPCVLFKSDNARELLAACATLGFTSEPSLERRWPHNSVLEREIRTIEECTRALHIAAGFQLHSGLWVHTVRYAAHTINLFHPAVGIEGCRYANAIGSEFGGMKLQLGQLVYYRLDPANREKFQASAAPGVFAGWRFDSGPSSFREVYYVLDYGKLKNREPGYEKAISVPREEIHVPRGNPILPMFTAAEAALSSFTKAEYEAIEFLDVPFSTVAPSTPVAKRHEYITLDRLMRLGATPGCKACKFDGTVHTPVCKARFDGLIKAEKIAASKSVRDAAPPDVERPDPLAESAPAAPEGDEDAPERASSSAGPRAPAGVAVQSSESKVPTGEFGLSARFLANERARNNTRRVKELPGENVLIEYGCEDESEIRDACERCKVHCVSLSQSTLDLTSQDDMQQVVSQAIPGVDAWFTIPCTHMSSHQAVHRESQSPKYARKIAQRQATSKRMLVLALNVADHIIEQGGRVSFQWSSDSGVLVQPEWIDFASKHELSSVACVSGNKATTIASNSKRVLEHFAKVSTKESSEINATNIKAYELADLVIQSLFPQRYFKSVPNLGKASALITKNLSRREWQAEPKALEAIAQEAEGLRRNGTWDDTTAMPLHELRSQARMPEYAEQIVQTYCEITGTTPDKLRRVNTPCIAESSMTDEDISAQGELHDSASRILMRCLWLARLCRADIAFAVTRLASRVTRWTAWEDRQVLRLVSYIHHTRDVCMNASCSWDAAPELRVYTDADFAACPYTSRSTSGIVVHIGTGQHAFPVMWQSRKQTSVARSTPEAEMISMASAMFSEVINLQTFLQSAFKSTVPIIFFQDNETVLAILKSGYSPKLRHLGRVHRVNVASMAEIFEQEDFSATYVNSKEQLANGLTKIIPPAEWSDMLTQLCLHEGVPHSATVSKVVAEEAERFASSLPRKITQEDLVQLLSYLPGESAVRPSASEAMCFTTGCLSISLRQ